jgi:predicted HAD superfamily Cof-like phosphohydrolase
VSDDVMNRDEAFQAMVRSFNLAIGAKPDIALRVKLIQEEAQEFIDAAKAKDAVEAIDAFCDLLYVVYGAADVFEMFLETREAEQTKVVKGEPVWAKISEELEDFNLEVSEVVTELRTLKGPILQGYTRAKDALEELANGIWMCGAEGLGVDLRPFFREVHRTNMHKLTGPKREDGKQLKPPGWKSPRIKAMYERARKDQPVICDSVQCLEIRRLPRFDVAMRIEHPDGGVQCRNCGGLIVDIGM